MAQTTNWKIFQDDIFIWIVFRIIKKSFETIKSENGQNCSTQLIVKNGHYDNTLFFKEL